MNNKDKGLIVFVLIVTAASIGENLLPVFPFIALGCFASYFLGRWEKDNEV